jgi:GNAT superfamily N-acetyltransferase
MLVRRTDRHRLPSSPRGQQPGRTPPGLLALRNQVAVGWCRVTPRYAAPGLERAFRTRHVDDVPILSISCVYICKGHRRKGIMTGLISAAIECRDAHVGALRVVRSVAVRIGGTPGGRRPTALPRHRQPGCPAQSAVVPSGPSTTRPFRTLLDKDPCTKFLVQVVCDNDRS